MYLTEYTIRINTFNILLDRYDKPVDSETGDELCIFAMTYLWNVFVIDIWPCFVLENILQLQLHISQATIGHKTVSVRGNSVELSEKRK